MKTVAILLSVYNRREKTLSCIEACYRQFEDFKAEGEYGFRIYMVDDGCTDDTAQYVAERFPEVVIIKGTGNLFWNRGMILAWNTAAKYNPDFYLWLNDDTVLKEGAMASLLENSAFLRHKAIVVGSTESANGVLSYGGRTKKGKLKIPDPMIPIACDIFNGNIVLVPDSVYKVLGTLDPLYSHGFGDYDYGIRAKRAGIDSVIAPGICGQCDRNPGIPKWRDSKYSLRERYKALTSPKGRPFKEQFVYDNRNGGLLWAVFHFFSLNLKVLFPKRRRHV
ncbi:MAG: glycosyltransferase family 2 protein [Candidatus Cryptobacteroides sp.]